DVCRLQQWAAHLSAFRERDSRGRLPLHVAALRPQTDVLRVVLQATASTDLTLEERTGEGDTPLTLAAAAGLVDNVRILLGHGASPHNTNSRNESPLLIGTDTTSHEQVPPSGGPSGEAEIVRHGSEPRPGRGLCGAGVFNQVDGHARGRKGSQADGGSPQPAPLLTLLSFLHQVGCTDILKLLLRHGAKVSSRDAHGVTPLAIAAERGNTEALDVLVRHGEHQNPSSSAKGQPHSALQSGCLPPGGDVKAQATNGDSVLYDAAGSGNVDSVELLLGHGADPNVASTPSSCRSTERRTRDTFCEPGALWRCKNLTEKVCEYLCFRGKNWSCRSKERRQINIPIFFSCSVFTVFSTKKLLLFAVFHCSSDHRLISPLKVPFFLLPAFVLLPPTTTPTSHL
ncbi:unnamed protein product, partial [Tetraodon nigroviridis]